MPSPYAEPPSPIVWLHSCNGPVLACGHAGQDDPRGLAGGYTFPADYQAPEESSLCLRGGKRAPSPPLLASATPCMHSTSPSRGCQVVFPVARALHPALLILFRASGYAALGAHGQVVAVASSRSLCLSYAVVEFLI